MMKNASFRIDSPWPFLYCAGVFGLILCLATGCTRQEQRAAEETYTVTRGTLDITVAESGNLEAHESIDIVSEVPHTLKIVEIVEEGTSITPADVENGAILVKLDASDLEDQVYQRESDVESAGSSFTEAKEGLAIQKSENQSSIRSAELNITYARNDLKKLVGDELAEQIIEQPPENIAALLDDPLAGGQSQQDLIRYQSDIELARIKVARAEEKLNYTGKLYEKQFVSKNELDTDALDLKTQKKQLQSAEAKLEIFRRYDFVKDFQKTWETFLEAEEKLERARAIARSRLAQAEAKLKSRESAFERAKQRLQELRTHIEKATIRAAQPGFVVYQEPPRWRNTGPIREGAEVRSQQTILRLPDLSRMAVAVNVHEAQVDLVEVGQRATISMEAIPGRSFTGVVDKKAVIPSSQSRWLNPDLKVYETRILMDETDTALRPGMTATVEIVAERLENVLHVPIQSVSTDDAGNHFVYALDGSELPIEIGKRNRVFVEVREGLEEGRRILMTPPDIKTVARGPADV